jgi:hypothetical protein
MGRSIIVKVHWHLHGGTCSGIQKLAFWCPSRHGEDWHETALRILAPQRCVRQVSVRAAACWQWMRPALPSTPKHGLDDSVRLGGNVCGSITTTGQGPGF